MILLQETQIGQHPTISLCNSPFCALDVDSLISSGLAIAVTLAIGFAVAYRVSHGVPGKLQLVLEFLLAYIRQQVEQTIGPTARFVIPLAATIAFYILVANWIEFFPLGISQYLIPANSDLNQTVAMALVVFVTTTWYSFRVLGVRRYLRRYTKPFDANVGMRAGFVLINIVEEIAKPLSLALRLFGNIFAGVVMIFVITLLPTFVAVIPLVVWKAFDVFVIGTIQAFIFMLLTIIYFGMAREGLEEEGHAGHGAPSPAAA